MRLMLALTFIGIWAFIILVLFSGCATHGDPCDDPGLHCNFVHPLPAHATHAVMQADGTVQLTGRY